MDYTGRLTVPVLWDKRQNRMVSNESADIMRMLGLAFDGGPELYPLGLQGDIDRWNDTIYASVNNGVYRVGFASTQEAYEKAAHAVFEALNQIDEHLGTHRFLAAIR